MDYGKHKYLKREPSFQLSSNTIDRIIARGLEQEIRNDICIKPFLPLINFESELLCPDVDVTKAHVAFGNWAIPKLKRELLSKDLLTAKRALSSLLDMVHDPERAADAIRLQIIPRLVRLLMSEDEFIRQHVLMVLQVLSLQPGGKMAIVKHPTILSSLSQLISDPHHCVRLSAAKTLLALATWYLGVEELIDDYYVYLIINQIENEQENDVMAVLMETLTLLLDQSDDAKKQALENKGIELSIFLDHPESRIRALGAAIVAQLARHPEGKKAIFEHRTDILSRLTRLLDDENLDIQTHAADGLMFLLIKRLMKLYCLTKLPTMCVLLRCAQYYRSPGLQVNAIKGLTCLAEHPQGREFLKQKIGEIEAIRVEDSQVKTHRNILRKVVNTVI